MVPPIFARCEAPECINIISNKRLEHRAKYCSKECSHRANYNIKTYTYTKNDLSTGDKGAISELLVSADLMRRGLEVYRAVSPASSCDLAVKIKHQIYFVEVRTGMVHVSGKLHYRTDRIKAPIVAVVYDIDAKIKYFVDDSVKEIAGHLADPSDR